MRVLAEPLLPVRRAAPSRRWLYANFMTPNLNATLVEHAAIIRAVAAGDAGAAERAVRANAFNGGARLVKALDAIARADESTYRDDT